MSDARITMLGASGAGKTTYMIAMYAAMQLGIDGFTLTAQDSDEDVRLTRLWENLLERHEWPAATAGESVVYGFVFNYAFRPMLTFDWIDYRGAALEDEKDKRDVARLQEYMKQSTCVFLCVSGEFLQEPLDSTIKLMRAGARTKSGLINTYMRQLRDTISPTDEQPFPVAVTITKYDLCAHRKRDDVIEDIKQLFSPLFAPGSGFLTMISPVSLGRGLADDVATGEIDPVNIDLPVSFAIWAQTRFMVQELIKAQRTARGRLDDLQRRNIVRRLLRADELRGAEAALSLQTEDLEQVQANLGLVVRRLEKGPVFLSGSRQVITAGD